MTLGCDFDITQLVDSNLGYHVCCYKVGQHARTVQ
jgi:hypothetical protein